MIGEYEIIYEYDRLRFYHRILLWNSIILVHQHLKRISRGIALCLERIVKTTLTLFRYFKHFIIFVFPLAKKEQKTHAQTQQKLFLANERLRKTDLEDP